MSEEEIKIECSNDVFKYTPDQIYDYIYDLQQENSQLKERTKKAIEYIESHKMIDYDEFEYLSTSPKYLIEILKGDKK